MITSAGAAAASAAAKASRSAGSAHWVNSSSNWSTTTIAATSRGRSRRTRRLGGQRRSQPVPVSSAQRRRAGRHHQPRPRAAALAEAVQDAGSTPARSSDDLPAPDTPTTTSGGPPTSCSLSRPAARRPASRGRGSSGRPARRSWPCRGRGRAAGVLARPSGRAGRERRRRSSSSRICAVAVSDCRIRSVCCRCSMPERGQRSGRVLGQQVQPPDVGAQRAERLGQLQPQVVIRLAQRDVDRADRPQHRGDLVAQAGVSAVETGEQLGGDLVAQAVRPGVAAHRSAALTSALDRSLLPIPPSWPSAAFDLGRRAERGPDDRRHGGRAEEGHDAVWRPAAGPAGRPDPGPDAVASALHRARVVDHPPMVSSTVYRGSDDLGAPTAAVRSAVHACSGRLSAASAAATSARPAPAARRTPRGTGDGRRRGPALGDRPDDQRRAAVHVAGHEHPGDGGLPVGRRRPCRAGADDPNWPSSGCCFGALEADRQQDQVGRQVALRPGE